MPRFLVLALRTSKRHYHDYLLIFVGLQDSIETSLSLKDGWREMRTRLTIVSVPIYSSFLCSFSNLASPSGFSILPQASRKRRELASSRYHTFSTASGSTISEGISRIQHDDVVTSPPARLSIDDWESKLDPYLPLELRSKSWLENLATFEGVRSADTLPSILHDANPTFSQNLLAHLGLVQGKWDALTWLSRALVSLDPKTSQLNCPGISNPWCHSRDFRLDNLSSIKLQGKLRPCRKTTTAECDITELAALSKPFASRAFGIGQVWQCLGHVVIEASNLDMQDQSRMMSYVYQLVAHIHSTGVISPSIYQFNPGSTSFPLGKPPFLHMMSSRIMVSLSDAMWKDTEPKLMADAAVVAATYKYKGLEMPGSELSPRVRTLGPEVWLELILWSCVHGSYFKEAGELIRHACATRRPWRWKTRCWTELQEALDRRVAQKRKKSSLASWFNRIAGTSEGYSMEPPAVALGEKTLSREVVAAIAEGLVTIEVAQSDQTKQVSARLQIAQDCRQLFGNPLTVLESRFWDFISHRLLNDSATKRPHIGEESLEEPQLGNALSRIPESVAHEHPASSCLEAAKNHTPLIHPTLLRALDKSVRDRDISNCITCFENLRAWADNNAAYLADSEFYDTADKAVNLASLSAYLPTHLLARLLDLMTEAKMFAFVRLLLPLVDPPPGPGAVYGPLLSASPLTQSSMMRYANATNDKDLEMAILAKTNLASNYVSDDAIRELLHSQMAANQWEPVETLLFHMQAERRMLLTAVDIAKMCSLLLQQPHTRQLSEKVRGVLAREYLPPRDYSQIPDYKPLRILSQMAHILSSIYEGPPGFYFDAMRAQGQASNPIMIPAEAFNILLSTYISLRGAFDGFKLFDKWCITLPARNQPDPSSAAAITQNAHSNNAKQKKVVYPNLLTLRILISPPVRDLQRTIDDGMFLVAADADPAGIDWESAFKRTMGAYDALPRDSSLKRDIARILHLGVRLGLVASKTGGRSWMRYEALMRPVSKEEVVRIKDPEVEEKRRNVDTESRVDDENQNTGGLNGGNVGTAEETEGSTERLGKVYRDEQLGFPSQ